MKFLAELKNVNFSYNQDKKILHEVNIQIPQGKITAIMGGSGSGKTTVLKLISRQIKANQGTVQVFNQDLNSIKAQDLTNIRKKMGVLFQFGALFTDLNIKENIAFPLREHTKIPDEIIDIVVAMKLEAVGLTGVQDLRTDQLSGGMARRVALARAMVMDPQLMMYDEPFTGLDPISLNTIAMLIRDINKNLNQTTILVSHDIGATFEIADYIYFMSNGKVIAHGSVDEIRNTENEAVKQFITGSVNGPFTYKYQSNKQYSEYLGI